MDRLLKLHNADPADADVSYMIAQEHAKAGEHKDACDWYDACLSADPGYLYAYYHKGAALIAMGDKAAAAASLQEGLSRARQAGDAKAAAEMSDLAAEAGA